MTFQDVPGQGGHHDSCSSYLAGLHVDPDVCQDLLSRRATCPILAACAVGHAIVGAPNGIARERGYDMDPQLDHHAKGAVIDGVHDGCEADHGQPLACHQDKACLMLLQAQQVLAPMYVGICPPSAHANLVHPIGVDAAQLLLCHAGICPNAAASDHGKSHRSLLCGLQPP